MLKRPAGKRALVVGLGRRTGVSMTRFLLSRGMKVRVCDRKRPEDLRAERRQIPEKRIEAFYGRQDPTLLEGVDLVVPSPGVPMSIPLLRAAVRRGLPVAGDLELFFHAVGRTPIVGVTGTNGKSTTTALTGHLLSGGLDCGVGGNIGTPAATLLSRRLDVAVLEISSFQLETIEEFRPHVAVWLNFAPDHLDRYRSLGRYFAAKRRIVENQRRSDFLVVNRSDARGRAVARSARSRAVSFGWDARCDSVVRGGDFYFRGKRVAPAGRFARRGRADMENAMASIAVARLLGIATAAIARRLRTFRFLPHRREYAGTIGGRRFLNDSSATSPSRTAASLFCMPRPVVLIAGGRGKNLDFRALGKAVREKTKALVLFGEAAGEIERALPFRKSARAGGLEEAVERALSESEPGDTVLFSPACTSFDMFRDFEHRGREFVAAVRDRAGRRR